MNSYFMASAGVVSLSFDDALDEHLDHAVPILNKHGFCGTFYVHLAATSIARRTDEWRNAAQLGHELGNHTIFHPADRRKKWVREGNAIDAYNLDRMRQELSVANQLLKTFDGCTQRTFAYPCSNSILGHRGIVKKLLFKLGCERTRLPGLIDRWRLDLGSTETSYVPVVRDLFVAGRGSGLRRDSRIPAATLFERFNVPSVSVDGWSAHELKEFTERGLAERTWVILQFHGIGGGHHLNCELPAFSEYIMWLYDNCRGSVATIRDVAKRLWIESDDIVNCEIAGNETCVS